MVERINLEGGITVNALETTLLFVFPGVLAMLFVRQFGPSGSQTLSDFEITLYGSALGIPIFVFLFILRNWIVGSVPFSKFITDSETQSGIIEYLIASIIIAFIFGVVIGKWLRKTFDAFINVIRHRDSKKHSESVWDAFAGNRSEALVRVYALGDKESSYIGILKRWSDIGDTESAIMIMHADEFSVLNPYLKYPKRSYLNTATNTVYEYFTEQDVVAARNEMEVKKGNDVPWCNYGFFS